jgi:prepilin-type N-terminal cleavage/methylation domain-containing protein
MGVRLDRQDRRRGFTLIELLICVSIIGVLASIAIPMLSQHQLRTKSTEAKSNLAAIRVVEEASFSETGRYLAAAAEPTVIPGTRSVVFNAAAPDYAQLGWAPEGEVYFSYAVAISADASGYTADAGADIDGDGLVQIWGYTKPDGLGALVNGGIGCDPTLLTPEVLGSCTLNASVF